MNQVVGAGDQAVIQVHHKSAVAPDGLVVRRLKDHRIAVCLTGIREQQAVLRPVPQVRRGGQERAADLWILVQPVPPVAEQIKGVLVSDQADVLKTEPAILTYAEKRAVYRILSEADAVFAATGAITRLDEGFGKALTGITSRMPRGVILRQLDDDGSLISATFSASTTSALLEFTRSLEASPEFGRINIRSLSKT
ncbi:MAG: hypothetical protein IID52_08790, partial [Proteobacteria bacterium]|nr:hypothetical protein [Pseudomonadota bacterium]